MIFKEDILEMYPLAVEELTRNGVILMFNPLRQIVTLIVEGLEQKKTLEEMERYENSLKHNRYSELEKQHSEYNDTIEL